MKLVYVVAQLNFHDIRFLNQLAQFGYDTWLVHFSQAPLAENLLQKVNTIWLDPTPQGTAAWLYNNHLVAALARAPRLKRVLAGLRPDLVIASYLLQGGFYTALAGYPFLGLVHGCDILREPSRSPWARLKAVYTLKRALHLHGNSEYLKEAAGRIYPPTANRFTVIPYGVDCSRFRPDGQERQLVRQQLGWVGNKILMMVRNWEPVYGISDFLKALPAIIQAEPDTRVLLLGDGISRHFILQQIEALALQDYIHAPGQIPHGELPAYYQAADIYVSTALSDALSVSMLEAMACGLPLIVSDLPAYQGWIGHGRNGWLVKPQDSPGIARSLVALLADEALRQHMGQVNLAAAQEADLHKVAPQFQQLIEAVARQSH